mmetsp:Transcript_20956/g.35734  ORF Transcript_20956/g.35734 Transcript_20956/m.35734 type:complete len:82 (+) Transcript_20956:103-348(+)
MFFRFRRAMMAQKQSFGNRIAVLERRDLGPTGRFEVVVRETGTLIFSRIQGMGFPDTESKLKLVALHIEQYLKELDDDEKS